MSQVIVLRTGYSYVDPISRAHRANCTIALVKSHGVNIIVDTGLPHDKDFILSSIQKHNVTPCSMNYVVCTHGHSDHVGNLNLFPSATLIVGTDISNGDTFVENNLKTGCTYTLTDDVYVISTPGHSSHDVSVVVKNTSDGVVTLAGDTFEKREDVDNPRIWREVSFNPGQQHNSRVKLVELSNLIIPGHGPVFEVNDEVKWKVRSII